MRTSEQKNAYYKRHGAKSFTIDPKFFIDDFLSVIASFNSNISRVKSLIAMPILLVQVTDSQLYLRRMFNRVEQGNPYTIYTEDLRARMQQDLLTYLEKQDSLWKSSNDHMYDVILDKLMYHEMTGSDTIENAWLHSIVVTTWTAFETLAGDLWEQAVNCHPQILAKLKGQRPKTTRNAPYTAVRPQQLNAESDENRKVIDINALERFNYNLTGVMGTLLRESDKVAFQSLGKIRDAYHLAFSRDNASVLFHINSRAFDFLSALRNLIVHKAGVVDNEFVCILRDLKYMRLPILNQSLALDIKSVLLLVKAIALKSKMLIRTVDEWIVNHPVSDPK
jgi:hypothetical protein